VYSSLKTAHCCLCGETDTCVRHSSLQVSIRTTSDTCPLTSLSQLRYPSHLLCNTHRTCLFKLEDRLEHVQSAVTCSGWYKKIFCRLPTYIFFFSATLHRHLFFSTPIVLTSSSTKASHHRLHGRTYTCVRHLLPEDGIKTTSAIYALTSLPGLRTSVRSPLQHPSYLLLQA
jgi:hypothetical protein